MSNFLYVFFTAYLLANITFAASILQTKKNRILISLDGDKVQVGQTIILKDAENKQVATAIITQAKGEKAIATLKTGKVDGSETISLNQDLSTDELEVSPDSYSKQSKNVYSLNNKRWAVLVTGTMSNMVTKQADKSVTPNIEDVTLTGMGFGLAGSVDVPVNNWLILRGTLGYEPFNVTGTAKFNSCNDGTSTDCNAAINYLSAGGFARVNLTKSATQFWLGAGATAKFPMSKSTTALRSDDIKLTVTGAAAGGVDYFISNKGFIPLSFEFQLFQASDTVTANQMVFRGGYGMAF